MIITESAVSGKFNKIVNEGGSVFFEIGSLRVTGYLDLLPRGKFVLGAEQQLFDFVI